MLPLCVTSLVEITTEHSTRVKFSFHSKQCWQVYKDSSQTWNSFCLIWPKLEDRWFLMNLFIVTNFLSVIRKITIKKLNFNFTLICLITYTKYITILMSWLFGYQSQNIIDTMLLYYWYCMYVIVIINFYHTKCSTCTAKNFPSLKQVKTSKRFHWTCLLSRTVFDLSVCMCFSLFPP